MMHAFWEERRPNGPSLGVIRVGRQARKPGDAYEISLTADAAPGPYVELIGLDRKGFTREHHDAIGFCLVGKGFQWWQRQRYKNGVKVPMLPQRIHLSSTFIKEIQMSIDQAHAHSIKTLTHAIDQATHKGFTDLASALQALAQKCEDGMPAAKGDSMAAQGDATAAIFHALDPVIAAAIPIDKHDTIHGDVQNVYNSMENVANAVHANNKARMHAALA